MAQDRMPQIAAEKMTRMQKRVRREVLSGPRGGEELHGPFVALLRSPELMSPLQKTGEYLRFHNSMGVSLTEFAILLVARRWNAEYEWYSHEKSAHRAGIARETIEAIREGHRPGGLSEDEQIVYEFCEELDKNKRVNDETYERAMRRFSERGVIDLIGLVGYYSLLAMILNVAQTPLPKGNAPQFRAS